MIDAYTAAAGPPPGAGSFIGGPPLLGMDCVKRRSPGRAGRLGRATIFVRQPDGCDNLLIFGDPMPPEELLVWGRLGLNAKRVGKLFDLNEIGNEISLVVLACVLREVFR